ncbi:hypothetical protein KSF_108090 [Reticulibacter mediterranei]|uniref:DUF2690 domain-containing protein n=1 Tax=Reticulibacter mediterranei TaxID=2778369 RepID=A0A8J3J4W1_9CHLR|nr:DUF2690 domain-containing protein [Reticulibacter mediterranei]GHP00762.1 hypothetical protein KSF_108090 [Reticulibacter mediterranei]
MMLATNTKAAAGPWWSFIRRTLFRLLRRLKQPIVQRLLLLILSTLVAISIGCVALLRGPVAYAATRDGSQDTCWSTPVAAYCHRQDPMAQGCTADAQTDLVVPIKRQGMQIGLLELRHSLHCNTWWGRCTSTSQGYANIYLLSPYTDGVAGPFQGNAQSAYTNMVFGKTPPLLQGIIAFSPAEQYRETVA